MIEQALEGMEAWEARWGRVPYAPNPAVDLVALLEEYARRMDEMLPFFHPRYAGEMLKPPHPVAVAAYLAAMIVNPSNHALDASQATSPMEIEAIRWLAAMFGLTDRTLGHLTSSGTIANLEALWVARALAPGRPWFIRSLRITPTSGCVRRLLLLLRIMRADVLWCLG